jgi:quinolinate synthase
MTATETLQRSRPAPAAPLSDAARAFGVVDRPVLEYTADVAREMAPLYDKVKSVIPSVEWPFFAPYIREINRLKKVRGAVILAHNYQTPEIFHTVADFVGDSLALARQATRVDAEIIVQCGVHFMAETSKLLNPDKTVLIPDMKAGCSLADSITGEDVRRLKAAHPGVPVVTYVNTSADVKAETDICCTSSNAVDVVRSLGVNKVIFIPDEYLAANVGREVPDVEFVTWNGSCIVHERFTAEEIRAYREAEPGVVVLAHPECPTDVVDEADFAGSTSGIVNYIKRHQPKKVVLITECSMSDNIQVDNPDVEFVRPCNLCPFMKMITLPKILDSLLYMKEEVSVDPAIAAKARRAVERMIELG